MAVDHMIVVRVQLSVTGGHAPRSNITRGDAGLLNWWNVVFALVT